MPFEDLLTLISFRVVYFEKVSTSIFKKYSLFVKYLFEGLKLHKLSMKFVVCKNIVAQKFCKAALRINWTPTSFKPSRLTTFFFVSVFQEIFIKYRIKEHILKHFLKTACLSLRYLLLNLEIKKVLTYFLKQVVKKDSYPKPLFIYIYNCKKKPTIFLLEAFFTFRYIIVFPAMQWSLIIIQFFCLTG